MREHSACAAPRGENCLKYLSECRKVGKLEYSSEMAGSFYTRGKMKVMKYLVTDAVCTERKMT